MGSDDIKRLLTEYQKWAKSICAPLFWQDEEGQTHNGTMTFLRAKRHLLGITNAHIAEAITALTKTRESCQLGGVYLDPGRLIALHHTTDLAVFELSDVLLATVGGEQVAATVSRWPPEPPAEGDVVLYGGYPGIYREETAVTVDFTFTWFAGKVASASERHVGMVLDIEQSKSVTADRTPPHADLGGWSGGPVFRVVDEKGIERLELGAIIYEYNETSEIAFAAPLNSLTEDGLFSETHPDS